MIVSRLVAKRRIANEDRPSFVGAWGLVGLDAALTAFAVVMAVRLILPLMVGQEWSLMFTGVVFGLGVFIPAQGILIISALWAVQSRWIDTDPPQ